jgi:hypothetical protein
VPPPDVRIAVLRVYLGGRYRDRIRETIARLKAKHAFVDRDDDEDGPRKPAEQLPLW